MNRQGTDTILHTLETQLNQRLEKLWKVFNWCSGTLISLSAIVLAAAASKDYHLTVAGHILISAIIIIVTIYSWAWIEENLVFEKNIRDQIDAIFKEELSYPELKTLRPDKAKFGYKDVVLLLGFVALMSVWTDELLIKFA